MSKRDYTHGLVVQKRYMDVNCNTSLLSCLQHRADGKALPGLLLRGWRTGQYFDLATVA